MHTSHDSSCVKRHKLIFPCLSFFKRGIVHTARCTRSIILGGPRFGESLKFLRQIKYQNSPAVGVLTLNQTDSKTIDLNCCLEKMGGLKKNLSGIFLP